MSMRNSRVDMSDCPTRYVVTYVHDGLRILAQPQQGRFSYETPEEAQRVLDLMLSVNSQDTLRSVFGDTSKMKVMPVKCWPGHFDPIGSVLGFDTPEDEAAAYGQIKESSP